MLKLLFWFLMQIWYRNVPHKELADFKRGQNWVKVTGEYLTFPGGGTQFKHGALHYIDLIQKVSPVSFILCCTCILWDNNCFLNLISQSTYKSLKSIRDIDSVVIYCE